MLADIQHIISQLLMIRSEPVSELALQATATELLAPSDKLDVLQDLKPCRRRVLLA